MVRQLPVVLIEGQKYFCDERLKEYRQVENPYSRIRFNEIGERRVTLVENEILLKSKKQKLKRNKGL
jgi:hypothetical protein